MRIASPSVILALLIAGLGFTASSASAFADLDCSDFSTQAQSQHYLSPGDPHGLDRDGDGRACDSLPCPCSSGSPQPVASLPSITTQSARIIRVVDGDTVDVRLLGSGLRRVRLLGLFH